MSKKQMINEKRRLLCEQIVGLPVRAAFMNGSLPHGVALAWTGERSAYLVNLKNRKAKEYVKDGKFLMSRALTPVKVYVRVG